MPPALALAEAAVRRGHEVTVLAQPSVRRRAESVGAGVVTFASLPDYDHRRSFDDQLDLIGAAIVGRAVGDDLLGVAAEVAADAIVVDANLAGALAAAETLPVPTVVLLHSMYATYTDVWFADLWPLLASAVNETRAGYRLDAVDGWPAVFAGHDRLLAVVPSSFEAPTAALPDEMRHFGFLVPRSAPAGSGPVSFPDGDGATVLVGLGTTSQGQGPMLQAIVDALAPLPVRAVVTTGRQGDVTGTSNVAVVDYVPHAQLLPGTDVFVSHAGLGSCAAGLAAGVPLVCTPIDRDQPLNAARVVALGAGVTTTPSGVAEAVRTVLADDSYGAAARAVAEQSRAEGGADAAIADLERLVDAR